MAMQMHSINTQSALLVKETAASTHCDHHREDPREEVTRMLRGKRSRGI